MRNEEYVIKNEEWNWGDREFRVRSHYAPQKPGEMSYRHSRNSGNPVTGGILRPDNLWSFP
jgi:hypothetical protein